MDVKPRRRYESPRRREQAEVTRAQILTAAREAFEAEGYAATSMNRIAAAAAVAPKTVYVAFGSKAGVLRALWHLLLRGDEGPEPVGERGWYRTVLDEPDPVEQLRLNARNSRLVKERVAALLRVIRDAAVVDPDVAALWARIETEFRENQGAIVRSLRRKRALRRGLGERRATDLLWALNHVDMYERLVRERGWTAAQYETWLADAFRLSLLEEPR